MALVRRIQYTATLRRLHRWPILMQYDANASEVSEPNSPVYKSKMKSGKARLLCI